MTQHTWLPWEAQPYSDAEEGLSIIAVHPDVPKGETPTRGMVAHLTTVVGAAFENRSVCEANAEFIVRACNSHDELVEALELARHYLPFNLPDSEPADCRAGLKTTWAKVEAAITRARNPQERSEG